LSILITITIINLKEKTIGIVADQTMSVNERSQVNTPVGTVATTGIVTGFEILLTASVITLLVFSGVKTLFVVIKKARNLSSSVPAPLVLFI
jgi:hypothetical protein